MITEGQVLGSASGRLGLGRREIVSPTAGKVQMFVEEAGLFVIQPDPQPEFVLAPFAGTVTGVRRDEIQFELVGRTIRALAGAGPEITGLVGLVDGTGNTSDKLHALITRTWNQ